MGRKFELLTPTLHFSSLRNQTINIYKFKPYILPKCSVSALSNFSISDYLVLIIHFQGHATFFLNANPFIRTIKFEPWNFPHQNYNFSRTKLPPFSVSTFKNFFPPILLISAHVITHLHLSSSYTEEWRGNEEVQSK